MAKKITSSQALANLGLSYIEVAMGSVVPACCSEGCEVEPDGRCSHGFPSVCLDIGII
jgi:hypothetical protein